MSKVTSVFRTPDENASECRPFTSRTRRCPPTPSYQLQADLNVACWPTSVDHAPAATENPAYNCHLQFILRTIRTALHGKSVVRLNGKLPPSMHMANLIDSFSFFFSFYSYRPAGDVEVCQRPIGRRWWAMPSSACGRLTFVNVLVWHTKD